MKSKIIGAIALVIGAGLLTACAGHMQKREGMALLKEGRIEEGLAALAKAVEEDPTNVQFRKEYIERREQYTSHLVQVADRARQAGEWSKAEENYKRVLGIDQYNARARSALESLIRERQHAEAVDDARELWKAGDPERALQALRNVLAENPEHGHALDLKREISDKLVDSQLAAPTLKRVYSRPITLEFRDANVKMVFESLSRTTNINFILDKDVRPDLRTTVYLRNASIDDALDLIAQTSQLQRKVLNSNTVLIYPGTPEKLKEYQDLVVRGFYLQNAEVKNIQNSLKSLLKTKDIVIDEKINLIVIRDTPDAVRLAERLIAMHDIPEPEVMLEVEILEVQRSRLTAIGIQWPSQLTLTPLASGGGSLTLEGLKNLNSSRTGASISNMVVNLRRDVTDADILANPRIRARNREKAKILIGDKLPVVTTTTTATGLVSDSIQYLDVGLKLDVEPEIRLRNDVAIKIGLEVSSIVSQITTPSGSLAYQIGTRNANTSLLLRDGETQILAGLISGQERATGKRVPGLGDVPILGRLFGSQQDENSKTEIVLSITPRIIRNLRRPEVQQTEFWSGTEAQLRTKPMAFPSQEAQQPVNAPMPAAATGAAPAAAPLSNMPTIEAPARNVQLQWQQPGKLKVGQEFKLALTLKTDGSIRSLPLQLSVDPKVFQITDVAEGAFFKQNNGTTSFSKNVDAPNGKAYVSIARSDVEGAAGEGVVAFLNLRALAEANSSEVRILQASAIASGDKQPTMNVPAALSLNVEK